MGGHQGWAASWAGTSLVLSPLSREKVHNIDDSEGEGLLRKACFALQLPCCRAITARASRLQSPTSSAWACARQAMVVQVELGRALARQGRDRMIGTVNGASAPTASSTGTTVTGRVVGSAMWPSRGPISTQRQGRSRSLRLRSLNDRYWQKRRTVGDNFRHRSEGSTTWRSSCRQRWREARRRSRGRLQLKGSIPRSWPPSSKGLRGSWQRPRPRACWEPWTFRACPGRKWCCRRSWKLQRACTRKRRASTRRPGDDGSEAPCWSTSSECRSLILRSSWRRPRPCCSRTKKTSSWLTVLCRRQPSLWRLQLPSNDKKWPKRLSCPVRRMRRWNLRLPRARRGQAQGQRRRPCCRASKKSCWQMSRVALASPLPTKQRAASCQNAQPCSSTCRRWWQNRGQQLLWLLVWLLLWQPSQGKGQGLGRDHQSGSQDPPAAHPPEKQIAFDVAGQTPWSSLVQGLEPFLISGQWVASAAGSNWPDSSGFVAGVKEAQLGSMRKEGLECRGGGASEGEVTRSGVREKRQVSIPNANGGGIQVSIPNANGGFLEQRNRPEAGKGQQAAQGTKDEHFGSDPPGCMRNEWPGLEGWHTEAGHLGSAPSGRMRKEGPGSLGWRAKGEGKVQCGPRTSEAGGEAEKEAGKVGGDSGRTSEAGGQAENRTGGAGSKRSRGKAAGKTKNRGSFTIQLSNITNWSAKAKSWVGAQQSDVQIIGEHHLLPGELDSGCSFLKMRDWRCFASPAERSEGGEGTSGGTLVAARMHLDARPVASATPTSSGWRCKPETPYAAATQITLGHRQVLILGGYCRGGIESREAGEVMRAWQDLTSGGDTLYIAGADFNVHPSVLRNSRFLESLKGVIISSGLSTCTGAAGEGNELDYFIVHRDLAPNVLRCTRHWGVPFAPMPLCCWRCAFSKTS